MRNNLISVSYWENINVCIYAALSRSFLVNHYVILTRCSVLTEEWKWQVLRSPCVKCTFSEAAGLEGQEWMDTAASGAEWIRKSCWPICMCFPHRGRKKRDCEGRDVTAAPCTFHSSSRGADLWAHELTCRRRILSCRGEKKHLFTSSRARPATLNTCAKLTLTR